MRKKHEHYSEEEKLHLLHSYYQSGMRQNLVFANNMVLVG